MMSSTTTFGTGPVPYELVWDLDLKIDFSMYGMWLASKKKKKKKKKTPKYVQAS